MAVSIDDLTTPLVPANVRGDLTYFATVIGLTISTRPTDPTYQLIDWLAKWLCYFWNTFAIPALRSSFGSLAVGAWLTAWAMSKGVARPLATYATGPVTLENRSASFVDVSAVGAVSITNPAGYTFVSQGPAPGNTGTMIAASGTTYAQTTLVFQAVQAGTASNTAANAIAGYPTTPASAPPGVYVATSSSTPAAGNPALLGTDAMGDPQLLALVRAQQGASASPGSPTAKILATALSATLPGGIPVATNRVRISGANAVCTLYCATPSGPTPGSLGSAGSELYQINAAEQAACAIPGLSISVQAATALPIDLGTVVLYVNAASNVSAASAIATATAAFDLWQSQLPVGGESLTSGGQGYALYNSIVAAFQSQINPGYPPQWVTGMYYTAGNQVSNMGQTFVATASGTSGGVAGPSGLGGADGADGLVWAATTTTGGPTQFLSAPGVYEVSIGGLTPGTDTLMAIGDVATFTYTLTAQVVPQ